MNYRRNIVHLWRTPNQRGQFMLPLAQLSRGIMPHPAWLKPSSMLLNASPIIASFSHSMANFPIGNFRPISASSNGHHNRQFYRIQKQKYSSHIVALKGNENCNKLLILLFNCYLVSRNHYAPKHQCWQCPFLRNKITMPDWSLKWALELH